MSENLIDYNSCPVATDLSILALQSMSILVFPYLEMNMCFLARDAILNGGLESLCCRNMSLIDPHTLQAFE